MNASTVKLLMAHAPTGRLPDMPIEASNITSGDPVARGAVLAQTTDRRVTSGVWSCEPGSFDWEYTWDEFVYILEGEVTITEVGGDSYTLSPGDIGHFPLGLRAQWKVTKAVRKFFVLRTPEPFNL